MAEFRPIRRNKPPEGSTSLFGAFYDFSFYIYVQLVSSKQWATGGSAEQPLQVPGGRAPNQPRPHPLVKIA